MMTASASPAYLPGKLPPKPGPLARYLPPLEDGPAASWLRERIPAGAWLLDPFGFSPRLALEAARAGYRVLVAANNPVGRFLVEITAQAPSAAELTAALSELATSRKGDERLEEHLQALYMTSCATCNREIPAEAFLWRKDADTPYARVVVCKECGEEGERLITDQDLDLLKKITAAAGMHRARVLERVAPLNDPDRVYAEEAVQHYLPRTLYALGTLINRLDILSLSPERERLLMALLLSACDRTNTLWPHPTERPRPRQLTVPGQFRENNVWLALEEAVHTWADDREPVPLVQWPEKLPESGGICLFEGRMKDLNDEIDQAPIKAVIGALPRPNQAFWTLSALWAGWLWGREAAAPFKIVLRRRRYDWNWHAAALQAACQHIFDLVSTGTPFFGLLAEPEPSFASAALAAAHTAGFDLKSVAMRTQHDALQLVWERRSEREFHSSAAQQTETRAAIRNHLQVRGEAVTYLRLHLVGLESLVAQKALAAANELIDEVVSHLQAEVQQALEHDEHLERFGGSQHSLEVGLWGLRAELEEHEPLADRVEMAVVRFLSHNPGACLYEIESELYPQFPGLLTPAKAIVGAVLRSYGVEEDGVWRLREEDAPTMRRADLEKMVSLVETIGQRLEYTVKKPESQLLTWEENGQLVQVFYLLASAITGRVLLQNRYPVGKCLIVIPGGRASLLAYKQKRDPALNQKLANWRFLKFRLLRSLADIPLLTRQTWNEQLASDPIEQVRGQLMMF